MKKHRTGRSCFWDRSSVQPSGDLGRKFHGPRVTSSEISRKLTSVRGHLSSTNKGESFPLNYSKNFALIPNICRLKSNSCLFLVRHHVISRRSASFKATGGGKTRHCCHVQAPHCKGWRHRECHPKFQLGRWNSFGLPGGRRYSSASLARYSLWNGLW